MRILLVLSLFLLGCNSKKAQEASKEAEPSWGVLEMAPSKQYQALPPPGSPQLIVSQDNADKTVSALKKKISTAKAIQIKLHPLVPFGSLQTLLAEAENKQVPAVYIQVRSPSSPPKTGWLKIENFQMYEPEIEKIEIPEEKRIPWSEFTPHWQDLYALCRNESQDCSPVPETMSEHGSLQVELRLSRQGVRVNFQQVDPPPEVQAQRVQVMDFQPNDQGEGSGTQTLITKKTIREIGEQAWFTFRPKSVFEDESTITSIVRSVCGSKVCPLRIKAEATLPVGRVLSALGSAFPDGSNAPLYVFDGK